MARLETLALEGKKQQLGSGLAGAASAVVSPKVACAAAAEGVSSSSSVADGVMMASVAGVTTVAGTESAPSPSKGGKARKAKKALPVKVRGSELAPVLIKAVLLLVVCYMLGQLRFLS
jgi:hypothetical protein